MTSLLRGLAAGAVGTTVLDAATSLDMALTGRPASSAPADTVLAAADALRLDLPTRGAREEAYGALGGLATGVGIGGVAALVRWAGVRLPLLAEAAVLGLGAMAATDGPMAVLEVSDPRTWSGEDWLRDLGPHLAYGLAVAATLRALEPAPAAAAAEERGPARPARLLRRSLAIGLAAGARSTLGLVPAGLAAGRRPTVVVAGLVAGELVGDKLPAAPSRLVGPPAVARVVTGATGAAVLARGEGAAAALPAVVAGALGAVVGTVGGALWRDWCAGRGWTWQGAVAEDAVGAALTAYACRV